MIFRSTTDRFNMSFSAKDPGIRILKSRGGKKSKIVAQSEQGKGNMSKTKSLIALRIG